MAVKKKGKALFVAERKVDGSIVVFTTRLRDIFSDPQKTRYQDLQERAYVEQLPVRFMFDSKKVAKSAATSTRAWMLSRGRGCVAEAKGNCVEILWVEDGRTET